MIRLGFTPRRRPPNFEQTFIKEVPSQHGEVTVRIEQISEDLIPYPKAYVEQLPKALEGLFLPHLDADKSICYLDEESTTLWIVDFESTLATIARAIEARIEEWGSTDIAARDFRQELSSYWRGNFSAFKVNESINCGIFAFYEKANLQNEVAKEVVVAGDLAAAEAWIVKRSNAKITATGLHISIKFRSAPYVLHGQKWPPEKFKDFLSWLASVDPSSHSSLMHNLVKHVAGKGMVSVSLRQEAEEIGFFIEITQETYATICRLKGKINHKGKKRRTRTHNQNTSPKVAAASLGRFTFKFLRSNIINASPEFIFTRNAKGNETHTLAGKRIALIGCGTIGGYVAHCLSQIGAGTGAAGEFHLFDDDTFSPGNLGRHLLGVEYLQEMKSTALQHFLERQGLINSVFAHEKFGRKDLEQKWDYIIDATGSTEFSLNLARWSRTCNFKHGRPKLIHGWIDAYGLAARALYDDGSAACFGCLTIVSSGGRSPRFRLFKTDDEPNHSEQFRRGCGKTYMPFSAQPGLTVAGMIQALCSNPKETFLQSRFSDEVIAVKNQILSRLEQCAICSK